MKIYSFYKTKYGFKLLKEVVFYGNMLEERFNHDQTQIMDNYFEVNFPGSRVRKISLGNWENELFVIFNSEADEAHFLLMAHEGIEI